MADGPPTQENRLIQVSVLLKGEDAGKKKRYSSDEKLLLENFTGQEGIAMPFHFDLVLRSVDAAINFDDVVGQPATIKMLVSDSTARYIDGIISTFTELERGDELTTYQATLVPRIWFLTRNYDCRIFQNRTVPQIIDAIFNENDVKNVDDKLSTAGKDPGKPLYPPREYCVQYNETDFDFISRLMEEEGIFYFFNHEDGKHTIVLADDPSKFVQNPLLPLDEKNEPQVLYGQVPDTGVFAAAITSWNVAQEVRPNKYQLRDYNFTQPDLALTFTDHPDKGEKLEVYEYPGNFEDQSRGEHLVAMRMQEIESTEVVISGGSKYPALMPGFYFVLKGHFRQDFNNRKYVPTSIFHIAMQGGNYRASGKDSKCAYSYSNTFTCMPHPTNFRPPRTTQLPVISSTQTAMVVGKKNHPKDEEIYTDQYGRVKVHFHWDRRKQELDSDGNDPLGDCSGDCSCWVRVAQPWTGQGWGHQWIPRIGHEVVVTFLEGNPDRPLITGMVYNGDDSPPFKLPDHSTQSGIKTRSSPGGGPKNFNMIRFEDKKGHEELYLHAENSMLEVVEGSQSISVGGNRSITVGGTGKGGNHGDEKELIYHNRNLHVKTDNRVKIDGKSSSHVVGDDVNDCDSGYYLSASGTLFLNAKDVFVQGSNSITLMAGSSSIVINSGGVTIVGAPLIKLNPMAAVPPVPPLMPAVDPPDDP